MAAGRDEGRDTSARLCSLFGFFLLRNQINTENVVKLKQKFSSLCCLQSLHVAGSPAKEEEEVDRILIFFLQIFFFSFDIVIKL